MQRQMLVAAVLFAVIAAAAWLARPRPDPRAGSEVVRGATVDVGRRTPDRYRIAYRTEVRSDGEVTESRSTVIVDRPFASRAGVSVDSFGRHAERQTSFWMPPGPSAADRRPDAVLDDATREGYVDPREVRRVAGRLCRVFRAGASSISPSLPPLDHADELTDVCVDEAGLVLEEVSFGASEEITRRTIATSVDEHPRLAGSIKAPKPHGDPRQVGSLLELEPDSRLPGDEFWELRDPPDGFERRGRYSVVPAGQPGFSDPTARSTVITFVAEVWTRGPDVLVIEQGATQGAEPFTTDPNARRVEAGTLGKGELRYSMLASEVRFLTGGTRFVRVRGTVSPSAPLDVADDLRAVAGGPLRVAGQS